MKKVQTGLYSHKYFFNLNEKQKYEAYKKKYEGFYVIHFINNGWCIEVTKRTI